MLLIFLGVGCSGQKKEFFQEITIARMPSPPMCKTTSNVSYITKVANIFSNAQKELLKENVNGWVYKVDINIDGQVFSYAVSETVFTDSDGRQYSVDGKAMIASLEEIYLDISSEEKEYVKK